MAIIRSTIMLSFLTAIFLAIGFFFAGIMGMLTGLVIACIFNFLSYYYSDKFVLRLYKARKANPDDYPELHASLEKIRKNAGIPKPELYITNMNVPNAFATGRSPKHSAVVLTKGLLSHLNVEEIEAVMAHEISHIKHRDTLISTMAATISGAITWVAYLFFFTNQRNRNAFSFLLLFILAPLAATLVRLAISRDREYFADRTGAGFSNPLDLASALEKIHKTSKDYKIKGNNATAHMFIVNPFSAGALSRLFSTHPPLEKRVAILRGMAV